jgi:hypothetical protein
MKQYLALVLAFGVSATAAAKDFPKLKSPLMGQTPPGKVAEVCAPGVISTDNWELEGVFAPGMEEFYYVTQEGFERPHIVGFRMTDGEWQKFTEFRRTGEPFITSDGQTMHLAKGYRVREGKGWSETKSLGPLFDRQDWGIMRLTASDAGTYVFDDFRSGDVIRISRMEGDERQAPEMMPAQFNSGKMTAHPFIAADESYLIFDSEREDGFGESDLYISFRETGGEWGPAINMGPTVNSHEDDFWASVTPDGKYLMFDRVVAREEDNLNVDIYWMDAGIIEELRQKALGGAD